MWLRPEALFFPLPRSPRPLVLVTPMRLNSFDELIVFGPLLQRQRACLCVSLVIFQLSLLQSDATFCVHPAHSIDH